MKRFGFLFAITGASQVVAAATGSFWDQNPKNKVVFFRPVLATGEDGGGDGDWRHLGSAMDTDEALPDFSPPKPREYNRLHYKVTEAWKRALKERVVPVVRTFCPHVAPTDTILRRYHEAREVLQRLGLARKIHSKEPWEVTPQGWLLEFYRLVDLPVRGKIDKILQRSDWSDYQPEEVPGDRNFVHVRCLLRLIKDSKTKEVSITAFTQKPKNEARPIYDTLGVLAFSLAIIVVPESRNLRSVRWGDKIKVTNFSRGAASILLLRSEVAQAILDSFKGAVDFVVASASGEDHDHDDASWAGCLQGQLSTFSPSSENRRASLFNPASLYPLTPLTRDTARIW